MKNREMFMLAIPMWMVGACDPLPTDEQDALREQEQPRAQATVQSPSRPNALEDRADIRRRAQIEIDRRIEARPQDAEHRDALIQWKEDQLRIDDMNESAPLPERWSTIPEAAR